MHSLIVFGVPNQEQKILWDEVGASTKNKSQIGADAKYNIYYVHEIKVNDTRPQADQVAKPVFLEVNGIGNVELRSAYICDGTSEKLRLHLAAHELGHVFGLHHPEDNKLLNLEPQEAPEFGRVMRPGAIGRLFLKFEWDIVTKP